MSDSIPLVLGKAPFHAGLFFGAVRSLIGEPDRKQNHGFDGYYDYLWELSNTQREDEISAVFDDIRSMMKCFDLQFPESRCDVAKWEETPKPDCEYLRITIHHEVKNKKA